VPKLPTNEDVTNEVSVATDLPDDLPVLEAELVLFEEQLLDFLVAMKQRG